MERPRIILDDQIRQIGEENFDSYQVLARHSSVPSSFFEASRKLSLDLHPEEPVANIASILFSIRFRTDADAWVAMKYAEAMSLLKRTDERNPLVDPEKLDVAIGTAVLVEDESDALDAIITKEKVEEHFEDPRNALNFFYFVQNLGKPEN